MNKKTLTVLTVLFFFAWGTLSWVTTDLLLSDQLTLLANLRTVTYIVAAASVFLRYYIRRIPDERILLYGAMICVVALVMMMNRTLLPAGYLLVGITRIFLIPANLGFVDRVLGARNATIITGGGFYLANAALSPVAEFLVEANRWRFAFGMAIVLLIFSAYVTYRLEKVLEAEEEVEEAPPSATHPPSAFGKGVIVFVAIQTCYGLVEIALFPLSELLLGERTDAGRVKGLRQFAALVGVIVTCFYRKPLSLRALLTVQFAGLALILAGAQLELGGLVFFGIFVEGAMFALLERESEIIYLEGLRGLPSAAVARQFIDGSYRLATIPGELVAANSPLFLNLGVAPILPLVTLMALSTPFRHWVARVLHRIASKA